MLRRWIDEKGKPHLDYLVCSLHQLRAAQITALYDARGGMEVDVYFERWFLEGTAAAKLGVERLVREVLAVVSEVRVAKMSGKVRLKLPYHPRAKAVEAGIEAHRPRNKWRTIWREN